MRTIPKFIGEVIVSIVVTIIDKLANETKLDMPDSEPNPQGDFFF
jgi:hypothetical protein